MYYASYIAADFLGFLADTMTNLTDEHYMLEMPNTATWHCSARFDLVLLSRQQLHGYEIKTEKDRLTTEQVSAYSQFFDFITLVTVPAQLPLKDKIPATWGFIIAHQETHECEIIREPSRNLPSVHKWAELLSSIELSSSKDTDFHAFITQQLRGQDIETIRPWLFAALRRNWQNHLKPLRWLDRIIRREQPITDLI